MSEQDMREKVIKGLECCVEKLDTVVNKSHGFNCIVCPYFRKCDRSGYFIGLPLMRDAIALLKKSFTPQEVYDIVVEHAQHDMRFKLGDKIDYSKQIITGLQEAAAYFRSSFDAMYGTVSCEKFRSWTDAIEHTLALLDDSDTRKRCDNDIYKA